MAGYLAQASGAAICGFFTKIYISKCGMEADAITNVIRMYALLGGLCFICYFMMNVENIEAQHGDIKKAVNCAGIEDRNTKTIVSLSLLFALDAFGGAFIVQSFLALYYQEMFDTDFDQIGIYLFICNIISGISGVISSKIVGCIGPLATMIFTHLPSNFFLIFIFFTNDPTISILLLFGRFCISQMDVPARQTFVTLLVSPEERSAANGITNIARSVGLSLGLGINGYFINAGVDSIAFSIPFLIAGGIKIIYDLLIGICFLCTKKKGPTVQEVYSMELSETDRKSVV